MLPQFRCSEIASEAILEQKQSCSNKYKLHGLRNIVSNFWLSMYAFVISQLTSNFNGRRYYGWQNSM